ncbi:hypothetical protein VE01_00532 [Pseudogymnoascus verrucosus]|uniref:Xanthan lyase n=1 Tax=Pseudogymnoascus verrucosus TaxID=342668 RepID=A0A2P2SXN7_9PEZI|nr:uncharacterized protein VE01_00532 [Pseudogymnoascus verrucosus]OBU01575.1 hypothetical protein VE01_00532 [Pseudogymnoascus verrucosus]
MAIFAHTPTFDVVVYGSTSGAVAASIQSAKLGLNVALVSPQEHIGGIQIEGLGATDIDNQDEVFNSTTVGGLALEFHRRISTFYNRLPRLEEVVAKNIKDTEVWRFESRVAEKVILEWLAEFDNIRIIFGSLAATDSVIKKGAEVCSIKLRTKQIVSGKVFIEASYEGDLLAASKVTTTHGRESSSTFDESLAGVRENTPYTQLTVDIDPFKIPKDHSSGLIYGISTEPFGKAGDGDKHLAAFSYRLPLTDAVENRLPFYKPDGYNPAHFELHRRFVNSGGKLYTPKVRLPGQKTDLIGSEAPLATDLLGMNDGWVTGSEEERKQILEDTARFTKGLMYFFANDDSLPLEFRQEWSRFGYCLDEFPDNNHFPRMLYIRDARRMVSDYVITEHTASMDNGETPVEDPVGVAYWPTDTHCVRRILRDGKVHNEGFIFKDGHRWRPFGIAYRALVPRQEEATNIITATCPSSSHVGYGAVRLEHQFYALGQACANACDIALKKSIPLQNVPYGDLKKRLLEQGMILDVSKVGVPHFPDN